MCIHCTSVLLSSAQMCRSSSMRVHHDCGYHAARDAHSGKLFISDMIRLRMSASPRVQQKKTKSKQYQTLKAFQPTSMKAWEAIVTTSLNFLECSFNVDGVAVIFRDGEDETSQNNRNAEAHALQSIYPSAQPEQYDASLIGQPSRSFRMRAPHMFKDTTGNKRTTRRRPSPTCTASYTW